MRDWFEKFLGERFRETLLKNEGIEAPVDYRYDTKTKEFNRDERNSNYCVFFVLPFDNELVNLLGLDGRAVPYDGVYMTRKKLKCNSIVEVTYKDIEGLVSKLEGSEAELFGKWASEDVRKKIEAEVAERKKQSLELLKTAKIHSLTKESTKAEYLHLLYCMDYDPEDNNYCWAEYNREHSAEEFPGTPDFISNDRAFYCLDNGEYFVISKNNYDTFWASQGNGFESCFSLTSQYKYIRGVPFWIAHRGFYMCYITDGDVTKWSAFLGHKCKLPKMSCRAWGYLRPNGTLALGKTYGKDVSREYLWNNESVIKVFGNTKPDGFVVCTDYQVSDYSVYYDNLSRDNSVSTCGLGATGMRGGTDTFYSKYRKTTFNKDVQFWADVTFVGGEFVKLELLPMTGLIKSPLNIKIEEMFESPVNVRVDCVLSVGDDTESISYKTHKEKRDCLWTNVIVVFSEKGISIKKEGKDERFVATL